MQVPCLQCNQEEADGCLFALNTCCSCSKRWISGCCLEDTDVFIVLLTFHDPIGVPLFQKCSTKIRKINIDIKKVGSSVEMCQALIIGIHAFTGCDTVSAFAGTGKAKALKMLTHSRDYQDTFMELGREWDVSLEPMNKLEHFTCHLCAPKTSSTKINELRYHLFCAKKGEGEVESHLLPPCKDCIVQHAL